MADEAKNAATALLDGLGISRVIVIDDDVPETPWFALVDLLDREDLAELGEIVGTNLMDGTWRERAEADVELKKALGRETNKIARERGLDMPSRDVSPALKALEEVLASHQPVQLTPDAWAARSAQLIEEAATKRTLFLVDQRLGQGREGSSLIEDALRVAGEGCHFCIFTAEVTTGDELAYWEGICSSHGFTTAQVGVVSKSHLLEEPLGFARMLKLSLTASDVERVRNAVVDASTAALEVAQERLKAIELPTLTSIVFESSHVEGAWEVETILRIVKAFLSEELESAIFGNADLANAVSDIGIAASVHTGVDERLRSLAFEIQHGERYVTGAYLADRRLALANGDIFALNSPDLDDDRWILVCQPCDLAIRRSGRRNGSPSHMVLLPIKRSAETPQSAHIELPEFDPPSEPSTYVLLTKPIYVRTLILDLAAFSKDGTARWDQSEMERLGVLGWQRRQEKVAHQFAEAFASANAAGTDRILDPFGAASDAVLKPTLTDEGISYPLQRIARLRERPAETVLQAYGLALSRTAEAHDLAKIAD